MLTTFETLSADAGCVPCGCPPMQKPAEGGEQLLMRSGSTVGTIYGLGVYLTLCSRHFEIAELRFNTNIENRRSQLASAK